MSQSTGAETPSFVHEIESGLLAAIEGGLASLIGGGSPKQAAETVATAAVGAAIGAVAPAIAHATAPIEARLSTLEGQAGGLVNQDPAIAAIVALLGRFFPHEVDALKTLVSPPPISSVDQGLTSAAR